MFGSPLSMIIAPEDPLEPGGVEPLVETVVPEALVEPVVPEPLAELDDVVPVAELVGTKLTASADVMQPPLEMAMILALPLKLYDPNSFHCPPFCC